MFRLIALAVSIAVAILVSERATAQDYPEYDGIYLRMKSGEFVELPSSPTKGAHRLIFSAKGKYQSQLNLSGRRGLDGMGTYFSLEDFENSPTVDIRNVKSIVVVGIAPQLLGLHTLVDARTANKEFVLDPTGIVQHVFNNVTSTLPASQTPDLVTRHLCAINSNNMRIKRVGQFVTEYEPMQGERWDTRIYVLIGNGKCSASPENASVMEIVLDGTVIASFRTGAALNAGESSAGESATKTSGWPRIEDTVDLFSFYDFFADNSCHSTCIMVGETGNVELERIQFNTFNNTFTSASFFCQIVVQNGSVSCDPGVDPPQVAKYYDVFNASWADCKHSCRISRIFVLKDNAALHRTKSGVFGFFASY